MTEMFDSATGNIPAGAQMILLPTDGHWAANNAAVKARFPDATYQTYTPIGQEPAEWIDVEPGCVWPELAAVNLWHRWKGNGITRGFYCSTSTRPIIQALLTAGDNPEWFEADPTQHPHVRAGDAETQWGWFGTYDETELALPVTPPVKPTPPEDYMPLSAQDLAAVHQVVIEGCQSALGRNAPWFQQQIETAVKAALPDAEKAAQTIIADDPPPAAAGTPAVSG